MKGPFPSTGIGRQACPSGAAALLIRSWLHCILKESWLLSKRLTGSSEHCPSTAVRSGCPGHRSCTLVWSSWAERQQGTLLQLSACRNNDYTNMLAQIWLIKHQTEILTSMCSTESASWHSTGAHLQGSVQVEVQAHRCAHLVNLKLTASFSVFI